MVDRITNPFIYHAKNACRYRVLCHHIDWNNCCQSYRIWNEWINTLRVRLPV